MGDFEKINISCQRTFMNSQKRERGQYPASLTKQAWSIKDILYGFRGNFLCGTRRVVPSGQDSSTLTVRVVNQSAKFHSSCPLAELAIGKFQPSRPVGFCALCFYFPTKMIHLTSNAPFSHQNARSPSKKSLECSINSHIQSLLI